MISFFGYTDTPVSSSGFVDFYMCPLEMLARARQYIYRAQFHPIGIYEHGKQLYGKRAADSGDSQGRTRVEPVLREMFNYLLKEIVGTPEKVLSSRVVCALQKALDDNSERDLHPLIYEVGVGLERYIIQRFINGLRGHQRDLLNTVATCAMLHEALTLHAGYLNLERYQRHASFLIAHWAENA